MSDPFAELVTDLLRASSMLSPSVSSESASTPSDPLSNLKSRCLIATASVCEEDASTVIALQQQKHIGTQSVGSASTNTSTAGSDCDFSPNTSSSRSSVHGSTPDFDARTATDKHATSSFSEPFLETDVKPGPVEMATGQGSSTKIATFIANPHAVFRGADDSPPVVSMIRRRKKTSPMAQKQAGKSLDLRATAPIFTPSAKLSQKDQKLNVKAATFQPKGSEKRKAVPKPAFEGSSPQRGLLVAATSKAVEAIEIARQNRRETGISEPEKLGPVHPSSQVASENRRSNHRFESWNVAVGHPIFHVLPSVPLSAMSDWAAYANEQAQLEHEHYCGSHSGWIGDHAISMQATASLNGHGGTALAHGTDETSEYADILKKTDFASVEDAKEILTSWAIISNYVHELARDAAAKNPTNNDLGTVNAKFCLMRQLQKMVGLPD